MEQPAVGSVLERVAWRVGLAAASRIAIGQLTVELPDGSRRVFGDKSAQPQDLSLIHI